MDIDGYEMMSLGNMGYSSVNCEQAALNNSTLSMQCPYGHIAKILDQGVNPANTPGLNMQTCVNNDLNKKCAVWPDSKINNMLTASIAFQNTSIALTDISPENVFVNPSELDPDCVSPKARYYVQFTCEQNGTQLHDKYN